MYMTPSSDHSLITPNLSYKVILWNFGVVFWCLEWDHCTFQMTDKNSFKSTNTTVRAPVFRHLRALRKSPWKFIIWMNELWLHCMLLVSYIQQYFNTSITVLTNQVWKLLIALFKVPNTGQVLLRYMYTMMCGFSIFPLLQSLNFRLQISPSHFKSPYRHIREPKTNLL